MIQIYFDGGAMPNPGIAYGSFEIIGEGVHERVERMHHGDEMGNNQAEYLTLIAALKRLFEVRPGFTGPLEIFTDSDLIVKQMSGKWKPKDKRIKALVSDAQMLLWPCGLRVDFIWKPRQTNVDRFGH